MARLELHVSATQAYGLKLLALETGVSQSVLVRIGLQMLASRCVPYLKEGDIEGLKTYLGSYEGTPSLTDNMIGEVIEWLKAAPASQEEERG